MALGPLPLRFVGIDDLDGESHVLVDGASRPSTSLTLSHWPGSPTPAGLARDLSTESALAYVRAPTAGNQVGGVVTSDHLDEDGLASLYCLVSPDEALRRASSLVAVARAGDFDVLESLEVGRTAWALRAFFDPLRSPFASGTSPSERSGTRWTTALYKELLGRLPELLGNPGGVAELWAEEDGAYRAGQAGLANGDVLVEERPDLDLAIVSCGPDLSRTASWTVGHGRGLPVHPAVVHGATTASRILVVDGRSYSYYDRYETWVSYRSRSLPARRDMTMLVPVLADEEQGSVIWDADPPGALVPGLSSGDRGESSVELDRVLALLCAHLAKAPPAWSQNGPTELASEKDLSGSAGPRGGTIGRGRPRWRGHRR